MYVIVGLGNPGRKYAGTRHNIGFNVVTRIADDYDISLNIKKHKAICGAGYIEGNKVLLALPQTYMNLSGDSVRALVDFFKINPENELIVIYDDVSLDVGRIRLRAKGSAGGHNGMKDIIAKLGTDVFARIKMGVGGKPEGWDLADHVLSRFGKEDNDIMRNMLGEGAAACKDIILYGIEDAMNRHNGHQKETEEKTTTGEAEGTREKGFIKKTDNDKENGSTEEPDNDKENGSTEKPDNNKE